jgi:hypothetical protein
MGDTHRPKGLRMRQLVSVDVDGFSELCEIVAMLSDPRRYRVKILGTKPAKVITVTRDQIKD